MCLTNFFVCGKFFFEHAVQTFATSLQSFGLSFAALWQEFCRVFVHSTNKQSTVQKSVAFSLEKSLLGQHAAVKNNATGSS